MLLTAGLAEYAYGPSLRSKRARRGVAEVVSAAADHATGSPALTRRLDARGERRSSRGARSGSAGRRSSAARGPAARSPGKETIPNLGSRSLFSSHLTSFFLRRFGKFTELRQVSGIIRNCSKIL